ncbi:DUF2829 domain-containing protein [Candidatus Dojkabacteria bacterium]|uniref:DUF2829 domain-containing protein n=1 Tax=Candidatus Dojkabacteria bacterium TaxID=2099670 RepID=A0A5C7J506_9BACT|nr:MAG: DUF2829 domain-containing protein [Candidatus Dojkabacteria bacterium]
MPHNMGFDEALVLLKQGHKLSRVQFRDTCYISVQVPDENSKMSVPYLYMTKKIHKDTTNEKVINFPFDPSCESIFAEDWYVVDSPAF